MAVGAARKCARPCVGCNCLRVCVCVYVCVSATLGGPGALRPASVFIARLHCATTPSSCTNLQPLACLQRPEVCSATLCLFPLSAPAWSAMRNALSGNTAAAPHTTASTTPIHTARGAGGGGEASESFINQELPQNGEGIGLGRFPRAGSASPVSHYDFIEPFVLCQPRCGPRTARPSQSSLSCFPYLVSFPTFIRRLFNPNRVD